jgi:GDP-mannose transporter
MALNVCSSAAYVLTMRSRIKLTGFSDWDSMYYNNLLTIPVLGICSLLTEDLSRPSLLVNLYVSQALFFRHKQKKLYLLIA